MNLMTSATVLLCSTSESVLHAWTRAMEGAARVVLARDYEQAIERIVLDPALQLLLLDSNWSPFDGARLISRLRGDSSTRLSGLPIFLIEQSGQSTTIELWLREGADGMLSGRRETQGLAALFRHFSSIGFADSKGSESNSLMSPSGGPATPANPILDIELKWQPAEGPIPRTGPEESPMVEDWARELGVRLRANDRWQARSPCSGALQLQCDRPDVLAPLNRLAWALHKRPELAAGKLTARFEDTTYQLPL